MARPLPTGYDPDELCPECGGYCEEPSAFSTVILCSCDDDEDDDGVG